MARGIRAMAFHPRDDTHWPVTPRNILRNRFSVSEACLAEVSSQVDLSLHALLELRDEPLWRRPKPADKADKAANDEDEASCLCGIPDDIILDILSRVEWSSSFSLRRVSRAWQRTLRSDALRAVRASRGALEQWLFVLPKFPKGGPFLAFDPNSATWHPLPPLPVADPSALEGFACASAAGKLFVIGGVERFTSADGKVAKTVTPSVWEFDSATWQWRAAPPMGTARGWCAAAAVGDRFVFVTGGQGASNFLKSAEVFDLQERRWRPIADMRLARCSHRAAVVEGKLLVIAGEFERHDPRAHLQAQGPARGQGMRVQGPAALPAPLGFVQHPQQQQQRGSQQRAQQHPHEVQGQRLTMHLRRAAGVAAGVGPVGGVAQALPFQTRAVPQSAGMDNASMEVYDEATDSWILVPDSWLGSGKVPCPVASVGGALYAVHHGSVHVWDKEAARWHNCGDTPGRDASCRPHQVSGYGCAELNGKLVLFGGTRDVWVNRSRLTQQQLGSLFMWDPAEGEGAEGCARGLHGVPRGPPMSLEVGGGGAGRRNSIMLWKEMPTMAGGSGHILASAVVTV